MPYIVTSDRLLSPKLRLPCESEHHTQYRVGRADKYVIRSYRFDVFEGSSSNKCKTKLLVLSV